MLEKDIKSKGPYYKYIMGSKRYFAKSFEEDFVLKTIRNKKKVSFQSVHDVLRTKTIKLNTKSFGKNNRLSCSILDKNYLKTYRALGLIFRTNDKPDFIYPFDLVLVSDAKKIIVQYYRIKDNLHMYYNHKLLPGYQKFVFRSFAKLIKKFPSLDIVWREANRFRVNAGYKPLPDQKRRLIEYNEVIFHKPVNIKPVAVFGYRKIAQDVAKKYNLPRFVTAKKFYESLNRKINK